MEIIDKLEPHSRSIYTGAIGYIGFNSRTDLNIVIRTIIKKGHNLYLPVGGAVVWDSVPELEWEETLHKARAMLQAAGASVPAKPKHPSTDISHIHETL